MYLNTNGFLFVACISYVVAAFKTSGLKESASEDKVFETAASDLVDIAKNAVVAARSAVAKLHNADQVVGQQTAASLAKTAEAIAATAQATLVGKQALVRNIHQELNDARSSLASELQKLVQSGRSAIAALRASGQAQHRFFTVAAAVSEAQDTDVLAKVALEEAKAKYVFQDLMLLRVKARKKQLLRKLLQAKKDLSITVEAAHEAEAVAETAVQKEAITGNETSLSPH